MSAQHQFGGNWTEDKLGRVRKYLVAYRQIMDRNERARHFTTFYVDAFAGTGYRSVGERNQPIFDEFAEPETQGFLKGSARIALELESPFNKYVFVERNPEFAAELERLKADYPSRAERIEIVQQEANAYLQSWCAKTNWKEWRAVVFLDPYGMQVNWQTLQRIAETKAIDLWVLFPLGQAVNRLLTQNRPPPKHWSDALTRVFGTADWQSAFYATSRQETLFGEIEQEQKVADFDQIGTFFISRLKSMFTCVAENPLTLRNSRGNPLYLLCFASGNPVGAPKAIKIAQDILKPDK